MLVTSLPVLTLRAEYVCQGTGSLPPHLGTTLRGVLGHCMSDAYCAYPGRRYKACHLCEKKQGCVYAQCFASPGNAGGAANPYVIHVHTRGQTQWRPGMLLAFDLTLIGSAVQRADVYLDALYAMQRYGWGAARIPFALVRITDPAHATTVFAGGHMRAPAQPYAFNGASYPASAIKITFDTPVRILKTKQKHLCRALDFETFFTSLTRRITFLSKAYGEGTAFAWTPELQSAMQSVQTVREQWRFRPFERYSINHKEERLGLDGIDGWAVYAGDVERFTPWIEAGRVLHVGKNATHDFGHYQVEYEQNDRHEENM